MTGRIVRRTKFEFEQRQRGHAARFRGHGVWGVEAQRVGRDDGRECRQTRERADALALLTRFEVPQGAVENVPDSTGGYFAAEPRACGGRRQTRSVGGPRCNQPSGGRLGGHQHAVGCLVVVGIGHALAAAGRDAVCHLDNDHARLGLGAARYDEGFCQRPNLHPSIEGEPTGALCGEHRQARRPLAWARNR